MSKDSLFGRHPDFLIEIPSELSALRQAKMQLREFLNEGLSDPDLCLIGLQEIIANAIEHGNRNDPQQRVTIAAFRCGPKIEFRIRDQGTGFDWKKQLRQAPAILAADSERGRGLQLALMCFDQVSFDCQGREARLIKFCPRS